MNSKRTFAFLLALLGAVLIIFCFTHFGKNLESNIFKLNVTISMMVYFLVFIDVLFPWVNLKDRSQKQIGSIGLRWFYTFFYVIISIVVMVIFNTIKPVSFESQIIIHGLILFMLLLGMFMTFSASNKVSEVYFEEKQNRDKINDMKSAVQELLSKIDRMNNVPPDIIIRIKELHENLRFLSPVNNNEGVILENKFIEELRGLSNCFSDNSFNMELINSNIKNCERTYKERKQVFSI